jgi:hypothetical protein
VILVFGIQSRTVFKCKIPRTIPRVQGHGPHTTLATTETLTAYNRQYPLESFTLETVTEMCVETKQFQQMKRQYPKYKFTHKASAAETN